MTALERINSKIILGARIWFVQMGTQMGTEQDVRVSDTGHPEAPESYASPGNWVSLGKIRTAKPQTDYKTADVEGVGDQGSYDIEEMKLATKRKLQFTTNDITPEAWQMTFGLLETPTDGNAQAVFAAGNDSLEGWLCLEMTDAYRSKIGLARLFLRVRLSLQNPLEAKSDPAQADYEASVIANSLAEFEAMAINPAPAA